MFHVSTTSTFREQPESSDNGCICKRLVVCICVTILVIVGSLVGIGLYVTHSNKTAPKAETKLVKWPSEMPAAPPKETSRNSSDKNKLIEEFKQLQRLRAEMPKEMMCSTEPRDKFLPFKVKFPSKSIYKDIYCPPIFTPTSVWWAVKNASEDVDDYLVESMQGGNGRFKFTQLDMGSTSIAIPYFREVIWEQYQQYQNVPGIADIPNAPEISFGVDVSDKFMKEYKQWCDVVKAAYEKPESRITEKLEVMLKDGAYRHNAYVNVPTPVTIKSVFYAINKECPDFAKNPFYVTEFGLYTAARVKNPDYEGRKKVWRMYEAFKLGSPPN